MRKIQMMGIDHSRATVAERELFSLTKAKQKELMEAVIRQQGVGGCVLLSTCNRTELYVSLQKEEDIDLYRIFCHIREIPQTAQDELQHLFCRRSGEDAVRHLFLLTGGLKSRIIGEDQILQNLILPDNSGFESSGQQEEVTYCILPAPPAKQMLQFILRCLRDLPDMTENPVQINILFFLQGYIQLCPVTGGQQHAATHALLPDDCLHQFLLLCFCQ